MAGLQSCLVLLLAIASVSAVGPYELVKIKLTWQEATNYCIQNNMLGLMRFDSFGHVEAVSYGMAAQGLQEKYVIWTDGTDVSMPGHFYYSRTGYLVNNFGFDGWYPGQPNNPTEQCMAAQMEADGKLLFHDWGCHYPMWFVCRN